jgi:hypothetical protein
MRYPMVRRAPGAGIYEMMATLEKRELLRHSEGFVVESPDGDLGWVEEVWLGETSEPRALAVRTVDGRHGLLLEDDVLAVDGESHWVVVPADPTLLELAPPRLTDAPAEADGRFAASWETTGRHLTLSPRRPRLLRFLRRRTRRKRARVSHERPLWQSLATLVGSLVLIVAFAITVAFLIANLVTGTPY